MTTVNANISTNDNPAYLATLTGGSGTPGGHGRHRVSVTKQEFVIVVFILYLATTARIPLLNPVGEESPGAFLTILRALGVVLSGLLVLAYYKRSLKGALRILPIITIVILSVGSVQWSLRPGATLTEGFVLLGMTSVGVYIGSRFDNHEILKLVAITTALVGLMSFIMAFDDPGRLGHVGTAGGWTGVFLHKNLLGQSMSLGALTWILYGLSNFHRRYLSLFILSSMLLLLILSNSMTSIMVLAIVVATLPLMRYVVSGSVGAALALALIGVATPFVTTRIASWMSTLLVEVGRDPSLTGRTELWQFTLEYIFREPTFGYGFTAFWQYPEIALSAERQLYWQPPTAHNGYLDIMLSIGVPGLILLILALIFAVKNALRFARDQRNTISLFPISFLVFFIIYNTMESISGVQPNLIWIIFVAVSVCVSKQLASQKGRVWPQEFSTSRVRTSLVKMDPVCNSEGQWR